jgi:hypothetical protein
VALTPVAATPSAPVPASSPQPQRPAPSTPSGSLRRTADGRARSVAWVFYGLLSILSLVLAFSEPHLLIGALVTGLYSIYLFRGGRFVLWIY